MGKLIWLIVSLPLVWLASFVIEAFRRAPEPPNAVPINPTLETSYINAGGVTLRYVKQGSGPIIVLLHTLRTQLDLYHAVIPALSKNFTVYAFDYPGHGYSDIPIADYDADYFADTTTAFLDEIDESDVTLCGVSIGANLALLLAGRKHPCVTRVAAINLYDYDQGRGMTRASPLARAFVFFSELPVIGETFMRLRNYFVFRAVMLGGVHNNASIPESLMREMYEVGNRFGHYRGFINLLRNSASWENAKSIYRDITVPVLMIWGEEDWAHAAERRADEALIAHVQAETFEGCGHFLPFDAPGRLAERISTFIHADLEAPK